MIVTCNNCKTQFKYNPKSGAPATLKFRCSRCSQVFKVSASGDAASRQPAPMESGRPNVSQNKSAGSSPKPKSSIDLSHIIAVSNQKGGVAKTTTSLNFGTALSLLKKRVLLVDLDIQANLTLLLGYQNTNSLYEVMHSRNHHLSEILIKTKFPNLWLLPANKNLVLLNKTHFGGDGFEYLVRNHLLPLKNNFDYIIIDTPPSIEFFTINALTAAGLVMIPSQCEYLSTHGIGQIVKMIDLIRRKTNPNVDYQLLLTMYNDSDTAARMIYDKMCRMYNGKRYKTVIELDGKVRESQVMNTPLIYYDENSRAGGQYMALAREFLNDDD